MNTSTALELTSAQPLPNAAYMGQGVNILRFDPNDPGSVHGYGSSNIFEVEMSEHAGEYEIPKGTRYQADPSSSFESVSSVIKSAADYSTSFSTGRDVGVKISGEPFGFPASLFSASFSASTSYRKLHSAARATAGVSTQSRADVTCWTLVNQDMPLTTSFQDAVANLPPTYERGAYADFLDQFGTHYCTLITFGGRGWQTFLMSSEQYTSLDQQGTNVRVGASVGFGSSVSAGTFTEKEQQQWQQMSAASESLAVAQFGGADLSTWDTWVATVPDNPLPVGLELANVSDLLVAERFPNDPNIDAKQQAMEQAITEYGLDVSDGLVAARASMAQSRDDEEVYRFAFLERHEFLVTWNGSSWISTQPTARFSDGPSVSGSAFWLQRPSGEQAGQLYSGDTVYVGVFAQAIESQHYLNVGSSNEASYESFNASDPTSRWQVWTAADGVGVAGQPIAQGTPILLQNVGNGKLAEVSQTSLMVTGDPQAPSRAAKLAFV